MNAINWFEIPTLDFDRATAFYERLFGQNLRRDPCGDFELAILPYAGEGVGGALVSPGPIKPAADGVLPYLNTPGDLDDWLRRVEDHGGCVVRPKTLIDAEIGYIATFRDTEGNLIGLHAAP
ncbi:VOC family protein [Chitiniphilus eburneus]|uniref:VOC family protein n=1 Tax=Chitiniphilus eburneus TaxID=2571148 RepID=A0A4U0QE96_9NEIS|nr:VOC family protein [Chitiniphilus eburneus]TJZ78962.1 VOC family protein [Chitiniphilus eburneus]